MKNKRLLKNVVMISIILLMGILVAFTMNNLKNSTNNSNSEIGNMGNAPSMPNDMKSPNDSAQNNNTQMDNKMNNDSNTPPEKPDDSSSSQDNMGENNMSMPNDMNSKENSNINSIYYFVFAGEGLIISLIIVYLIMSGFNKKTFKQVFINKDKIVINILSVIILSIILTYTSVKIVDSFIVNNNENSKNNSQDMSSNNITYSSVKEISTDENISDEEYESSEADENAVLVTGDITSNISNVTINKTGDSSGGDNTSFYGTNSGILAKDGANLTLKNITVNTDATGANGVFSYGGSATTNNSSSDGTTVTISDSSITTTKDNSGGIMTTGGGVMKASNLKVNTSGTSSAAIRTDRGGGNVTVDGGTYQTTGQGSPAIYSTANVSVSNAKLISKASEGVVIEGKNSVTLDNVTLTDTNSKLNGKSTTYKNIFLYQSMSGDASSGTGTFTAKNSKITTNKGDTLYVTNTTATINLENNTIVNNDSTGNFLRAQKDSWGNSGSNGGDVILIMTNQKVSGNIVIDSISTLDMTMKTNSYFEGSINESNSAKSIKLTLDKTSKIKLTSDSYITSLDNEDSSNSNIDFNGYKLYINGKEVK